MCDNLETSPIMTVIDIDETVEISSENAILIGHTLDEVFAGIDKSLSEAYNVDFFKINKMIDSGELNLDELTNEILLNPEFKYKSCLD